MALLGHGSAQAPPRTLREMLEFTEIFQTLGFGDTVASKSGQN